METQKMDENYSIKSLHRAIQVLKVFTSEKSALSLTEINQLTKITKPSLQRILSTLVYEGLLTKDEESKKYKLGIELYFLGNLVQKDAHLLNISLPVMEDIHNKTGEAILLSARYRDLRRVIANINSNHVLTANQFVGDTSPLYIGASGKILLAYQTEEEIDEFFQKTKLEKINSNTIIDVKLIKKELVKIRENNYAYSSGERLKGVSSITTPIFNRFSEIVAAISIIIPDSRLEDYNQEQLITMMQDAANSISEKLSKKMLSVKID